MQMLLQGQDRMKAAADRHRRPAPCLHPRTESVALHQRSTFFTFHSRKLAPRSLRVHPTFHVSKVKPVKASACPVVGRVFAHGTQATGSARNGNVGPPSSRLTTHRNGPMRGRCNVVWVAVVAGDLHDPILRPKLWP
ncbi:hypothetical protein L3Q82_023558 [Scortum barcoo]|uniref:Uncharacterized protein n=1 Tax=Scortum barcoo TaxID=214431 RepID=A0ACB8WVL1_9TELE|nr:hypothetical protein L3Q82_023558 [Scortum barcoo]